MRPQVLFDPNDANFASVAYADEQTMVPVLIADPSLGLYSPTSGTKGNVLTQNYTDALAEIVVGRSPVSNLEQISAKTGAAAAETRFAQRSSKRTPPPSPSPLSRRRTSALRQLTATPASDPIQGLHRRWKFRTCVPQPAPADVRARNVSKAKPGSSPREADKRSSPRAPPQVEISAPACLSLRQLTFERATYRAGEKQPPPPSFARA